jgi:hypothetical protein
MMVNWRDINKARKITPQDLYGLEHVHVTEAYIVYRGWQIDRRPEGYVLLEGTENGAVEWAPTKDLAALLYMLDDRDGGAL